MPFPPVWIKAMFILSIWLHRTILQKRLQQNLMAGMKFWYAVMDSPPWPSGPQVVTKQNRSRFGSDLPFLPLFARWIFRCFRLVLPAFFAFWVKSGSEAVISVEDWRAATLRHSPHYLSSYHKWRKNQRFVGVFVHHGSCFGLGDRVKVTTADILIRCDGVAPW